MPNFPEGSRSVFEERASFSHILSPIKADITPEKARELCVETMRLQLSFSWIPKEDYVYPISVNAYETIPRGTLCGGFPCTPAGSGNLFRMMDHYDPETHQMDMRLWKENPRLFGNTCSGAACAAWARVISSVTHFGGTTTMTQRNGFLTVGPYSYDKALSSFMKSKEKLSRDKDYTPRNVCQENGYAVMYESYAATLPGDGLVSRGHIRMVSKKPIVVRDPKGNIVPGESYITFMDQVRTWKAKATHNGTPIQIQGGLDVTVSFYTLFKDGYIPFTFAEFQGTSPIQKGEVHLEKTGDGPNEARVISNYPISDIFLEIQSEEGQVLAKEEFHSEDFGRKSIPLSVLKSLDREYPKRNFIRLSCRIFNGECHEFTL